MRKAMLILIVCLGLGGAGYAALVAWHNREAPPPDPARLQQAFEASVGWLQAREDTILESNNPALWWMIQQSAEVTGHPTLVGLFGRYEQRYLAERHGLWRPLFYPGHWSPFRAQDLQGFPDYNLHFIYAISCDTELGDSAAVQAQLDPGYCATRPWRPACATHQLMGFRFMQRSRCGDPRATEAAVESLQLRIARQATWDPRVVDVFMQRVLMLVESGARDAVRPAWVERILDAQRVDGGWSGVEPLLKLPGGRSLGFGPRGLSLAAPQPGFHMTAQGVFLLSLLLHPEVARD